MSNDNDEDITRIEDLPNLNGIEDDEDFTSLDDLADSMNLNTDEEIPGLPKDLDELQDETPPLFAANEDPPPEFTSPENDFETPDFETPDFEMPDFSEDEGVFDTNLKDQDDDLNSRLTSFDTETEIKNNDFNSEFNDEFEESTIDESYFPEEDSEETLISASAEVLFEEEEKEEEKELKQSVPERTPIERESEEKPWSGTQNLDDVTEFGEKSTYSTLASEGNPPFSVILKNPRYKEDVEDIITILKEVEIVSESDIEQVTKSLTDGQYLVSRISEYCAIILCHKLRRFDVEILMGLTEEINPPKSYDSEDRGLLTKASILNNKKHHFNFKAVEKENILATTLPQIEGHIIKKHFGIITRSTQISANELKPSGAEDELIEKMHDEDKKLIQNYRLKRENYLASNSQHPGDNFVHLLDESTKGSHLEVDNIYKNLLDKLKDNAMSNRANGLVGVNFMVTPLPLQDFQSHDTIYQIQCSGNMVWIEKR